MHSSSRTEQKTYLSYDDIEKQIMKFNNINNSRIIRWNHVKKKNMFQLFKLRNL